MHLEVGVEGLDQLPAANLLLLHQVTELVGLRDIKLTAGTLWWKGFINTMILKILECPHQTNSWSSLLQGAAFPGPLNDWSIEAEARKQTLDQRNFSYQVDSSAFRMSFEPAVASLLLLICNIWTRLASGFAGKIFLLFINYGVALAPLLSWFLPFLSKWINWNGHHHVQTTFNQCLCSSWD